MWCFHLQLYEALADQLTDIVVNSVSGFYRNLLSLKHIFICCNPIGLGLMVLLDNV